LGPEAINDLSVYQFHKYMGNIAELEKMVRGEQKEDKKYSNKELVERARKRGLRVPKRW